MQPKFVFEQATKTQGRLRLSLAAPSGGGKTFTALKIATSLAERLYDGKGKIGVIDSEHGSASKYADKFNFKTLMLDTFSPLDYVAAIEAAEEAGFDILVIDSLSHAWMGKDGALEQLDKVVKKSQAGNSFNAWKEITPMQTKLIEAILGSKMHIIATMRSKTEYVIEENDRGKKVPRKVGLAPVQRDGLEYEFDVVGEIRVDSNELVITKTRCSELADMTFKKAGDDIGKILAAWLGSGAPMATPKPDVIEELLKDAEVKVLFDKLDTAEAKRRLAAEKYGNKEALTAALTARIAEKTAAPAA